MNEKQIIVMRKDLNMRKGKMVAQGAHASLAAIINGGRFHRMDEVVQFEIVLDDSLENWLSGNFKKVCCSIDSEAELLEIHQKAVDAGLRCALIKDSGLTEFGGVPTYTCCAIGPADPELIDPITGNLKLL